MSVREEVLAFLGRPEAVLSASHGEALVLLRRLVECRLLGLVAAARVARKAWQDACDDVDALTVSDDPIEQRTAARRRTEAWDAWQKAESAALRCVEEETRG